MNIVLTGFMSSGKTVVGKRLSGLLNMGFIDTDAEIEKNAQMKISDIFERFGEDYFRNLETDTISRIAKLDFMVISTGGGAVMREENISALSRNGVLVNLETNAEIITERLGGGDSTRPLTKGKSIEEILAKFEARRPFYDKCHIKIILDKEKGIEDVAREIIEILEEKYDSKIWSGRK